MSFSLYIHIPWCQSKCPYCDFNSHAAAVWPEADYTRALIAELEYRAAEPAVVSAIRCARSFLAAARLRSSSPIDRRACSRPPIAFGIEADAEITLEANPGTVDLAKLRRDARGRRQSHQLRRAVL